jgi:peptide/nickel transport system permease protein
MSFKPLLLWTDAVVFVLLAALVLYVRHVRADPALAATWRKVFMDRAAMAAGVVVAAGLVIAVLDSLHYRPALPAAPGQPAGSVAYDTRTWSVLDRVLLRLIATREATYSEPLAYAGFTRESVGEGDAVRRVHPRLAHGGAHLADPAQQHTPDLLLRGGLGALAGLVVAGVIAGLWRWRFAGRASALPWRAAWRATAVLAVVVGAAAGLSTGYHVLGTDRTGNDVLYQCLKSLRTAFVIGALSTLATLPLAVGLGLAAGWFRGWVDEAVQYLYTVLSSVPNVLLIAACVLMVQVFVDTHPEAFATGAERSDVRLFLLCMILGLTGWAGLCRLVRAEVLKLRELDYVQAATAFGVGPWRIMGRHLLPNVMHLVLITTVLDFCSLILYEAVLSYVGVGVDPGMNSFGGMINLARSEMSRDPLVWWSFASAFVFMVGLVLAANLFADGVQTAFDPRAKVFRPRARRVVAA